MSICDQIYVEFEPPATSQLKKVRSFLQKLEKNCPRRHKNDVKQHYKKLFF